MVPLAFGLVAGSVSSIRLVARFGTTRVVLAGLLGLGGLLVTSLTWTADMAYWPLGPWFFAAAVSMRWIIGPAIDAVMGAVPEEKAGVASAMNDVTRQVGGSLGTAVIGSLYASRLGDAVADLPPDARAAAEDSIGRANAVAEKLPAAEGARLADAAADAFTQALAIGFTVAAAGPRPAGDAGRCRRSPPTRRTSTAAAGPQAARQRATNVNGGGVARGQSGGNGVRAE